MNIICAIFGHWWDYASLKRIGGEEEFFRCCMRCERSESILKWVPVEDGLPKANEGMLLVRVHGSALVAMAVYVGKGNWKVQPLYDSWYVTDDRVKYWTPAPEPLGINEERKDEY